MQSLGRRDFLVRSGLALGATLLSGTPGGATGDAQATTPARTLDSWEAIRSQFSLSRDYVHMAGFFLASHPKPVREAIERHRRGLDANPIGYWLEHAEKLEATVLRAAADYLGGKPTDIALTDSTTMGLGLLYGGLTLRAGQEILTTVHDHYSTDTSLRLRAERTGGVVKQIALYENLRTVSVDELVDRLVKNILPQTRIVAVTWVHSSTGLKLPIQEMAKALEAINQGRADADRVIFCVDGVHALGVEDFRLSEVGCDFFIAGTHKWMFGPRGTGLVWGQPRAWPIAKAVIPTFNEEAYGIWMKEIPPKDLPPSVYMTPGGFHSFEHRWALDEAFTFHRAIGKRRVTERIHVLNDQLKEGLAKMPHVTLHTPRSRALSAGIVCFEVAGLTPETVVDRLLQRKIVGSVTPYATKYARLAPSLLTSPEEVERTLNVIGTLERNAR
jgi:selenocysteine lyase/cysteine desulfurase